MTGIIILNKPQEFTSFDAVAVVRKLASERSIGHTGTLDPMATGVLPLLLGKATKAANLLPDTEKTYVAGFRLGVKTETGDIWGKEKETCTNAVGQKDIQNSLASFTGNIWQIPPMYSAVSVGGTRLYALARQGIEVEREKRPVYIKQLKLQEFCGDSGRLLITCSKGTYIRTLIEDLAESLGTLGTMSSLVRTNACGFALENSYSLEQLKQFSANGEILKAVLPVESLFEHLPRAVATTAQQARFLNGGELAINRLRFDKAFENNQLISVYGESFLGLARVDLEKESLIYVKHFK